MPLATPAQQVQSTEKPQQSPPPQGAHCQPGPAPLPEPQTLPWGLFLLWAGPPVRLCCSRAHAHAVWTLWAQGSDPHWLCGWRAMGPFVTQDDRVPDTRKDYLGPRGADEGADMSTRLDLTAGPMANCVHLGRLATNHQASPPSLLGRPRAAEVAALCKVGRAVGLHREETEAHTGPRRTHEREAMNSVPSLLGGPSSSV